MADALLTGGITLAGGIVVFVVGQVFVVLFAERIRTQARAIEAIAQSLVIYAREYTHVERDPGGYRSPEDQQRFEEASQALRRQAAILRSTAQTLKWYRLFECLHLVMRRRDAIEASKLLIRLSNLIPCPVDMIQTAASDRKQVEKLLEIQID